MKLPCTECNGLAEFCDDQNEWVECDHCDDGNVERCVAVASFPESWKRKDGYERLLEIQRDAMKCREDTQRLIQMNSKARESYGEQLSKVLKELNQEADNLNLL